MKLLGPFPGWEHAVGQTLVGKLLFLGWVIGLEHPAVRVIFGPVLVLSLLLQEIGMFLREVALVVLIVHLSPSPLSSVSVSDAETEEGFMAVTHHEPLGVCRLCTHVGHIYETGSRVTAVRIRFLCAVPGSSPEWEKSKNRKKPVLY